MSIANAALQGITCPKGYWPSGRGCVSLAPGTTFVDGQTTYSTCPVPQYVPYPGGACTACPAGFGCKLIPCNGAATSTESCTPCSDELSICSEASIAVPPRKCPLGYYSSGAVCVICPEGSECPDATAAVPCAAGKYSGKGFPNCLPCPAGYECTTSKMLSLITRCPAGSFSLLGDGTCT